MRLKLRLTKYAKNDLSSIKAYIAEHDRSASERVRLRIRHSIETLRIYPHTARATSRPGILMAVVPRYDYKIYCQVVGDELTILRILHSSRHKPVDQMNAD